MSDDTTALDEATFADRMRARRGEPPETGFRMPKMPEHARCRSAASSLLVPSEFERQNGITPYPDVVDVGTGLIWVTPNRTRDDIIRDQFKHQSECA